MPDQQVAEASERPRPSPDWSGSGNGGSHLFELLPRETLVHLTTYLNDEDLVALSRTCRLWRHLLNDESVWRSKCLQHGLNLSRDMPTISNTPWRDRFLERIRVRKTWEHPREATVVTTTGRKASQRGDVIAIGRDRVFTVDDEDTLMAWNSLTGDFCWERRLHSGDVLLGTVVFVMDSAKGRGTIVAPENGETVTTWEMGLITKVAIHDDRVVSIGNEGDRCEAGSLRFWTPEGESAIAAVRIRSFLVDHLIFDGDSLIIVFSSGDIEVWNALECSLQHIYPKQERSESRVCSLVFDEARMYLSFIGSEFVRVWSFGEHHETSLTLFERMSKLHISEEILIGLSLDHLVKVWDKDTMMARYTLDCRGSILGTVSVHSTHLVTSNGAGNCLIIYNLSRDAFRRHEVELEIPDGYEVHRIQSREAKVVVDVRKKRSFHPLLILDFARPKSVNFDRAT